MTIRKKIHVLICVLSVLCIVIGLCFIFVSIENATIPFRTTEERADIKIAQYKERPYANNDIRIEEPVPFTFSRLSINKEKSLTNGCSLRFSFVPQEKVIEPDGVVNYSITLSNKGKETCTNVSFSVYYRDTERYITSDKAPTASDYYWAVGDLESSERYTVLLKTQSDVQNGREIDSEACATGDNSQDVCSNNVIFINAGTSLSTTGTTVMPKRSILKATWGTPFQIKEFGVWVWDSPGKITPAHASGILAAAKKNSFNRIYITIDDYLHILTISNKEDRESATKSYMRRLEYFIREANAAGIEVDVEGGSRDWAYQYNRINGYHLIDFVKEYNQLYKEAKIHGLQYDVEPYLLPEYESNKEKVLTDFVEFVDESAKRMSSVDASFSVVIPHFYDSKQRWSPAITFNGKTGYTFTQLLTVLEQKRDSTLIIMAYRNFFEGDNSILQITESEIKEASESEYTTKIIIAQETGDVSPEYITYYGHSKEKLYESLSEVYSTFNDAKNFGGAAIHYLDPFLKLK